MSQGQSEQLESRCLLASAGQIDLTYGFDGVGGPAGYQFGGQATSITVLPDGRTYTTGELYGAFAVVRTTRDGMPDRSFGTDGRAVLPVSDGRGGTEFVNGLVVTADGKPVLAGHAAINGFYSGVLVRFNADGTPDATFGSGGRVLFPWYGRVQNLLQRPDGKLVVVGTALSGSTYGKAFLAQFHPDGTPDTSFGAAGRVIRDLGPGLSSDGAYATDAALQPDGKVVMSFRSSIPTHPYGEPAGVLARFTVTGGNDVTFGQGGKLIRTGPYSSFHAMELASDGSIFLVGGSIGKTGVTKHTASGLLDTSYGVGGNVEVIDKTMSNNEAGLRLHPDGTVLASFAVYNSSGPATWLVSRVTANGQLDSTFGTSGRTLFPAAGNYTGGVDLAIAPDGKIIVTGMQMDLPTGHPFGFTTIRLHSRTDLAPTSLSGRTWRIIGDAAADSLSVDRVSGDLVAVLDGVSYVQPVDLVDRIEIELGAGNDAVTVTADTAELTVDAGPGADSVIITSTSASARSRHIAAGEGNDSLTVTAGGGQELWLTAGLGTDAVTINGTSGDDYFSRTRDGITASGMFGFYHAIEQLRIDAMGGADSMLNTSTPTASTLPLGSGTSFTFDAGEGDDSFVSNGQPLPATVSVVGGAGNDVCDLTPVGQFTVTFDGKAGTDRLILRGGLQDDSFSVNGNSRSITWSLIDVFTAVVTPETEQARFELGPGNDFVTIRRTISGLAVTVDGDAGNDGLLTPSDRPISDVQSDVWFEGGDDYDQVRLVDNTSASRSHTIADGTYRYIAGGAAIRWSAAEAIFLTAGTGADTISATGGSGVQAINIDASVGNDALMITPDAVAQFNADGSSPLPGAGPAGSGDRLEIALAGATDPRLEPTGPGSGVFEFANRLPITFAGMEFVQDVVAPRVVSAAFARNRAQHRVEFSLTEPVYLESPQDVVSITDLHAGTPLHPALYNVTLAGNSQMVLVDFPGFPEGRLPAGLYRVDMQPQSVRDIAGNALVGSASTSFSFLPGDADADADVDIADFAIMAASFNRANTPFDRGDFDYSGTVDIDDFAILAGRFNQAAGPVTYACLEGSTLSLELLSNQSEDLLWRY